MSYLAKECCMSKGVGVSKKGLPSFDRALLEAGVGNYNLVRLSSILPAEHVWVHPKDIAKHIPEGSLLPTAYSTISSDVVGETIVSTIGVGIPADKSHVGVIMEYSTKNVTEQEALETLMEMIREAFEVRGWELENMITTSVSAEVKEKDTKYTTFACISEW
jgi:arginine decarboxylase